jgi:hypothetical protein
MGAKSMRFRLFGAILENTMVTQNPGTTASFQSGIGNGVCLAQNISGQGKVRHISSEEKDRIHGRC